MTNKKLKVARVMKGVTQFDLRLRTGISQTKISLFERGYLIPKNEEKVKLSEALGMQSKDLFEEE